MDLSTGISIVALIVSVAACLYTRLTMVNQNKPYIRAWIEGGNLENPSSFAMFIENKGNGPAIVKSLQFNEPGSKYGDDLDHILQHYRRKNVINKNSEFKPKYAISKDEKILLFSIDISGMVDADRTRAYDDVHNLKFVLVYTTITGGLYEFKFP